MKFHRTELGNGLNLIAELNESAQSLAIGFFVRTGARDETPEVSGVSHFLEHMAFKGNEVYTADDVNRIFDEVGAKYNAQTSEEVTLFYAAILPEYLPVTFELLASILQPSLRTDDFDMEKNVILEEIGMYEDQPGFTAYEAAMQVHFRGHPLGQSILGSSESVKQLQADQMREYHGRRYGAQNIVLAITGKGNWDEIVALAEQHCGSWEAGESARDIREAMPEGGQEVIRRPSTRQEIVMQMSPAPPANSPLRFAAELVSVIVGDDGGSRLYWDLVDPGEAEAADLGYHDYDGSGAYLTYLSCQPEMVAANLERVAAIYDSVNADNVTADELDLAKNKVASRIVLRSERPMGRLSSLGVNWIYRGEYRSVADDLATLQAVSRDEIRALLNEYPLGQLTTAAVGPLEAIA